MLRPLLDDLQQKTPHCQCNQHHTSAPVAIGAQKALHPSTTAHHPCHGMGHRLHQARDVAIQAVMPFGCVQPLVGLHTLA